MNSKQRQETHFQSPFGDFELARFPKENDPNLRAWSAADELLLEYVQEQITTKENSSPVTLVANDTFGGLGVCLNTIDASIWSDSYTSLQALEQNLRLNPHIPNAPQFISSIEPLPANIEMAVMMLPKSHEYLRFQLEKIKQQLEPNGTVVVGVMVKHFHPNVLKIFESIIGPTHTSLAKKKARLIISTNDSRIPVITKCLSDYASTYPLDGQNVELKTLPNVFSREKLDIGTRTLLPLIPQNADIKKVLDLGCGNGALGIACAKLNPQARIHFCDESFLAIESARLSATNAEVISQCEFLVTDSATGTPQDMDLILCNPPFHQQHSMHTQIAHRMFKQAHQHLNKEGELLVVANRHLKYTPLLQRQFDKVKTVFNNNKFMVIRATK